jgi:hypothetical protein
MARQIRTSIKKKMGKYISLSKEGRKKIMEIFKISKGMVSLALNFKVDSVLTRRVQYSAIKHYGGELRMDLPIEDTIHDSNGCMVQRFKNGYKLILDKHTGKTTILDKDRVPVKAASIKTFEELETLQTEVAAYK